MPDETILYLIRCSVFFFLIPLNLWKLLPFSRIRPLVKHWLVPGSDYKIFLSVKMLSVSDEVIRVINICCVMAERRDRLHVAPQSIIVCSSRRAWRHQQGSAHNWLLLTSHRERRQKIKHVSLSVLPSWGVLMQIGWCPLWHTTRDETINCCARCSLIVSEPSRHPTSSRLGYFQTDTV